MMLYVDSSAFVKAISATEDGRAVRTLFADHPDGLISSALLDVEVGRALARSGESDSALAARLLATVRRIDISRGIISIAAQAALGTNLRSLDAIHLATALAVPEAVTVVTYDHRLTEACASSGLTTLAPA